MLAAPLPSFGRAARIQKVVSRAASGEGEMIGCRADLTRELKARERVWFETCGSFRNPPPQLFLFRDATAHFLCRPKEKSRWLETLARYLEEASLWSQWKWK